MKYKGVYLKSSNYIELYQKYSWYAFFLDKDEEGEDIEYSEIYDL